MIGNHKDTHQQTQVTNPVHDESLACCLTIFFIPEPKTNQKIGAEANTFPTDKQDHIVAAQYQQQHGENEEI